MKGKVGRPPKLTKFDEPTLRAARRALLDIAQAMRLPQVRYPSPTSRDRNREVVQPRALDLAVLALEVGQAMEVIAAEHVAAARDLDGATWSDVGDALGITMQSAHARFALPPR
jgi:hypothetical protein